MDKAAINNVITALVTAAILGVVGWGMGIFEKGSDAVSEDQIIAVVEAIMVTDAGKTYKARLAEVDIELAVVETRLVTAAKDIDDIEEILGDLASE